LRLFAKVLMGREITYEKLLKYLKKVVAKSKNGIYWSYLNK
jgi:hypothetical protein